MTNDTLTLDGMTYDVWRTLPEAERDRLRDLSDLTPELIGLEGWRVEAVTTYGETRRFYVGRSTGWKPIHLDIARRDSSGGPGADRHYETVRKLFGPIGIHFEDRMKRGSESRRRQGHNRQRQQISSPLHPGAAPWMFTFNI